METAPDTDPLRKFLSGKRRAERRTCDLAVEVSGGGTTFAGRAIDVSEGGVMIWLDEQALEAVQPGIGMIEALGLVERYFANGAQVVFPAESLRLPVSIVRLTPPKDGRGVYLGCRFERALLQVETSRLLASRQPAPLEPLTLAPRKGVDVFLLLFPEGSIAAGPRFITRVLGLGTTEFEVRVEPPRPMPADEVKAELSAPKLSARAVCGGTTVWEGTVRVVGARAGISRTPVVDVRLATTAAFRTALTKRFQKSRRCACSVGHWPRWPRAATPAMRACPDPSRSTRRRAAAASRSGWWWACGPTATTSPPTRG
jgi:hypothetical protein